MNNYIEKNLDLENTCWNCNGDISSPCYSLIIHLKNGEDIEYLDEVIMTDDIIGYAMDEIEENNYDYDSIEYGEFCPYCLNSID